MGNVGVSFTDWVIGRILHFLAGVCAKTVFTVLFFIKRIAASSKVLHIFSNVLNKINCVTSLTAIGQLSVGCSPSLYIIMNSWCIDDDKYK